jgi:hypothetical protein
MLFFASKHSCSEAKPGMFVALMGPLAVWVWKMMIITHVVMSPSSQEQKLA